MPAFGACGWILRHLLQGRDWTFNVFGFSVLGESPKLTPCCIQLAGARRDLCGYTSSEQLLILMAMFLLRRLGINTGGA